MKIAVEFRRIFKSFHGVKANSDISFKVQQGSIHAIIGENGAGKSTAMKILYGTYGPDSGEVLIGENTWGGRLRPWSSPKDAIRCGIGMVHQHFMLAGPHTVLDNIILGVEQATPGWNWLPTSLRPIHRKAAKQRLITISNQYGLQVDPDARIEDLSVGVQQRIEILKLLYHNAQILILDEPTAVLTPQETIELFSNLKKLCHEGKTILMITHKLKEVMSVADRVTVFRAGQVVGEREIRDTSTEELATLMVGRKVNLQAEEPPKPILRESVLKLTDVSLQSRVSLHELNFQVRQGEIVGISGVEGNGQAELLQILLHPREYASKMKGSVSIFGKNTHEYSARQVKDLGVGVIPDDRLRDALLLERSVQDNFLLGLQRRVSFQKNGIIAEQSLEKATQKAIEEYDIRPRSASARSGSLSGGNQQKLVIAREFYHSPQFLIAAQPTRGVDVGAIEFIHKRILKARNEGCGVLLISSELDEILALSDRILVMYEGRVVAEFKRGEATERALGLRMGGAVH
jgi:general nucleoside transport system ATP-binding protein